MNFAEKLTNAQVGLIIGAIAVIVILVVWRLVHKRIVRGSGFPIDIAPEEPKPVLADEQPSISPADVKPTVVILPEDPLPYAKRILASEPITVDAPPADAAPADITPDVAPVEPVEEMPVELTPVTPAEPQPEPQPVEEPKETVAVETAPVKTVRKRVRKAPAKAPFAKTKNPARTVTKDTPKKAKTAPKKAKSSPKKAADTKKTAKTAKSAPAKKTTKKAK